MTPTGSNPLKSGTKPCNGTPDDCYEDELSTWLQYPMEDAFEKNYCSDLFGHWMLSSSVGLNSTSSKQSTEAGVHGPSTVATGVNVNANNLGAENVFRSDMNNVLAEMNHKDRLGNAALTRSVCTAEVHKGRFGVSECLKPKTAAGALAMGAERAAGVSQTSRDAFGKVRTCMQHPPLTNQLSNSSPAVRAGMKSDAVKVIGRQGSASTDRFANQTMEGETQNTSNNGRSKSSMSESPRPMAGLRKQVSNAIAMGIKGYHPNSSQLAPDHRPKHPAEPNHLQVSRTQESGCSHVTDEFSIRSPCVNINSACSKEQVEGNAGKKINPPVHDGRPEKERLISGSSDAVVDASSGGVQASTDISTKEATHTRKHKLDDSESPSEDAEGESVEVKQPRKASTSKRNRAAEVHNLSERNRRNRINEKLRALQELIPNSCKTDKASVLDEAIEYMKTLQLQLQMVSMRNGMTVSPMVIPMGMPHMQMAPVHSVGIGVPIGHAGMGIGMGMGMGMGMGLPIGSSMGMMDLSQGVATTGQQFVPGAVPNVNTSFQEGNVVDLHDAYRVSSGMDSLPSDNLHMVQQNTTQPSDHAPQTSQSMNLHKQQKQ